jgi:hypothetical protein
VEAGLGVEGGLTRLVGHADDVVLKPYEKGRPSMEAYLRWEEELDSEGKSPHELLPGGDRQPSAAESYNRKLWMKRKGDVPFWGKFWKSTPGPGATRGERYATNVGAYHCKGDGGAGGGGPRHVG